MDAIDEEHERKERLITLEAMYKDRIDSELYFARQKFPDFRSAHEGFAVLLEEVNELWDVVRSKHGTPVEIKHEAIQVAAMALRFLTDCCDEK